MVLDQERIKKAFCLALEVHKGHTRKGGSAPYISHLLIVAGKVLEEGGDEDQYIAGLLHDAVEDHGGLEMLTEIEKEFGKRVAGIVSDCSDSFSFPKKPWRERKEHFIEKCKTASPDSKLVIACDKWHNLYDTLIDYHREGEIIWERFRGGKDGTLWYYKNVIKSLENGWNAPILDELRYLYDILSYKNVHNQK